MPGAAHSLAEINPAATNEVSPTRVSLIDAPGQPFHDPAADRMLFETLESEFRPGPNRRLIKLDMNINDPAFAQALVDHFLEIVVIQQ